MNDDLKLIEKSLINAKTSAKLGHDPTKHITQAIAIIWRLQEPCVWQPDGRICNTKCGHKCIRQSGGFCLYCGHPVKVEGE